MVQPTGDVVVEPAASSTKPAPPPPPAMDYDALVGRKHRHKRQCRVEEHRSAGVCEKARAQLTRMGWTEGTGLGKRRDGITTHIVVQPRPDQAGLGITEQRQQEALAKNVEWWKDTAGDVLARLSKKKAKKIFTDEELFQATGGARFGMRAAPTKNLHKWKRTESVTSEPPATQQDDVSNKKKKRQDREEEQQDVETKREKKKRKKDKKRKSKPR